MALRIKTRWHRSRRSRKNMEGANREKTMDELAGVVAFNIWKIAQNTFSHMEKEGFRFAQDRQAIGVIVEVAAFLTHIADRMVYEYFDADQRREFITGAAKHLGQTLQTNQMDLHGPGDYLNPFIDTLNQRFAEYSECSFDRKDGPGHTFKRVLGDKIAQIMASSDAKWVVEQVMDIEVPEAVKTTMRLVTDVMGLRQRQPAASSASPNES